MERRRFLQTVGAGGGLSTLSGCWMLSGREIVLESVLVGNWDRDSSHTPRVTVEWGDETIYERTHELEARSGVVVPSVTIEEPLPDESGSYVASLSTPSSESSLEVDVKQHVSADCDSGDVLAEVEFHLKDNDDHWFAVPESCPSD